MPHTEDRGKSGISGASNNMYGRVCEGIVDNSLFLLEGRDIIIEIFLSTTVLFYYYYSTTISI